MNRISRVFRTLVNEPTDWILVGPVTLALIVALGAGVYCALQYGIWGAVFPLMLAGLMMLLLSILYTFNSLCAAIPPERRGRRAAGPDLGELDLSDPNVKRPENDTD